MVDIKKRIVMVGKFFRWLYNIWKVMDIVRNIKVFFFKSLVYIVYIVVYMDVRFRS